jgi:DNA-binding beta-propeller fold protein YncE
VTQVGNDRICVIDRNTNTIIPTSLKVATSPVLCVNPRTNRLYIAKAYDLQHGPSGHLAVIDGETNVETDIPAGRLGVESYHAISVNPETNKIYVIGDTTKRVYQPNQRYYIITC